MSADRENALDAIELVGQSRYEARDDRPSKGKVHALHISNQSLSALRTRGYRTNIKRRAIKIDGVTIWIWASVTRKLPPKESEA